MRYQIINNQDDTFNVIDSQNKKTLIENESMGVCDSVIFALTHKLGGEFGECGEIAETII